MLKRTILSKSLLIAFSGTAAMAGGAAFAQQADQAPVKLERVEVTGSAIKRIEAEGALPVSVLTAADIKKTGATSVTDLIQMLPSMQGFVPAASSVNGGGGGVTTAALHSLPSKYTLVLLDGQRVAPMALGSVQGGGFGVNLESIPIEAIERVEILTDGASALYGSDAVAGVVNFILKKNKTDGEVSLTYNAPQHPGGGSWNFGVSKGFGDLDSNGYNILLSYSHDNQDKLMASQRSFSAQGGYFPFSANGTNYIFNARTGNTEPANLTFSAVPTGSPAGTVPSSYTINPYYTLNNNCGSPLAGVLISSATSTSCRFNYAATVQDLPSSTRDSGLIKGSFKLGDAATVWGELVLSQYKMNAQFAPSAQPLGVSSAVGGSLNSLYTAYVQPYLTANNLTITKTTFDPTTGLTTYTQGAGKATMGYRSVQMGGRADIFETDARHFALGIDGTFKGWDYKASLTLSNSQLTDTAAGGYTDFDMLKASVASGAYNPILGTGTAALGPALLNGTQFSKTVSDLNTLHFGAQHDLFQMSGGTSIISLGGDYSTTHYTVGYHPLILSQSGFSTQPASSDFPVGGNYGQVPFDASRTNWGAYAEWLLPVTKQLEVTASGRFDNYSKTHSNYVFNPVTILDPVTGNQDQIANADLGNTFSATTGKLSLRYTPVESLLLRGSYGTGFKAPNISDIAGAQVFGGSTAGTYSCPFPGSAGCLPAGAQYDLVASPNGASGSAGLKAETSKQWTLGFRVDPTNGLSLGLDLWDVKIANQVLSSGIAEQVAFKNPQQYASLFINPYTDPAGFPTIALIQQPFNGAVAEYQGIDWDFSYRTKLDIGNLAARWTGTQMIKQEYNFGPGLPMNTDLGVFGPDQQVVFRTTMNFVLSLQTGDFINTLSAHYKSGYKDASYPSSTNVFLANPDGTLGASVAFDGLNVPSYTTFDWQTNYSFNKALQLTAGIKNLFDRNPPLSLQTGGGGNQVGYDGRYTDPIGRQFYLSARYTF